jgi:hypothetical protein
MTDGRHWANIILAGTNEAGIIATIEAVNKVSTPRNVGSTILACAQILGQVIATAGPDIAPEVRAGIIRLIDDYAMRAAISC